VLYRQSPCGLKKEGFLAFHSFTILVMQISNAIQSQMLVFSGIIRHFHFSDAKYGINGMLPDGVDNP
jgi:hypothetical protein